MSVRTHEYCTVSFYAVGRHPLLLRIADVRPRAERERVGLGATGAGNRARRIAPRLAPVTRKEREAHVDEIVRGNPPAVALQPDVRCTAAWPRARNVVRDRILNHQ